MIEYPHFEVFRKNGMRWGRLLKDYTFAESVTGYNRIMDTGAFRCELREDGTLTVCKWAEWDFGSGGVTVQDLAMVRESLRHDALCMMIDRGLLPYSTRWKSDNLFARGLWRSGAKGPLSALSTGWRWLAVTAYSQTVARYRAEPYQGEPK